MEQSDAIGFEIQWIGKGGDGTRLAIAEGDNALFLTLSSDEGFYLLPEGEGKVWTEWFRAMERLGELDAKRAAAREWHDERQKRRIDAFYANDPERPSLAPLPLLDYFVPVEAPKQ